MNLGSPDRPMVSEEPELDDILPAKDDSWDHGVSCSVCSTCPLNYSTDMRS